MTVTYQYTSLPVPPSIITPPQSQTVLAGNTVVLGVTAGGSAPLAYQWFFNTNNALAGETNASLTLVGVTTNQTGAYSVVVSNADGSMTSAPAALVVVSPAMGGSVSYTASYPQPLGAFELPDWSRSVTLPKFNPSQGVLNSITIRLSGTMRGSAQAENTSPSSGANLVLTLGAALQLFRPGTLDLTNLLAGVSPTVTNTFSALVYDGVTDFGGSSGVTYAGLNANQVATMTYNLEADKILFTGVGSIVLSLTASGQARAIVGGSTIVVFDSEARGEVTVTYQYSSVPMPPSIITPPQSQTVLAGSTVVLGVTAGGSAPLAYQWFFNTTTALAGETNASLTLASVTANQTGAYSVVITNAVGSVTSAPAALVVGTSRLQPAALAAPDELRTEGFTVNLAVALNPTVAYVVQVSPTLSGNPGDWVDLKNFPGSSPAFQFLDTAATNAQQRFYRVLER